MSTAEAIKSLLTRLDLTQIQLADKIGVSQPALSKWLKGRTAPEPENLKKLASIARQHAATRELTSEFAPEDSTLNVPLMGYILNNAEAHILESAVDHIPLAQDGNNEGRLQALKIKERFGPFLMQNWLVVFKRSNQRRDVRQYCDHLVIAKTRSGKTYFGVLRSLGFGKHRTYAIQTPAGDLLDANLEWCAPVVLLAPEPS